MKRRVMPPGDAMHAALRADVSAQHAERVANERLARLFCLRVARGDAVQLSKLLQVSLANLNVSPARGETHARLAPRTLESFEGDVVGVSPRNRRSRNRDSRAPYHHPIFWAAGVAPAGIAGGNLASWWGGAATRPRGTA